MKKLILCMLLLVGFSAAWAQNTDTRLYELRIYHTNDGRMNALIQRFTNHTTKLFEKHGMTNEGYWLDMADSNKLLYIVSFPNLAARDSAWKAFIADPEWKKVAADSEKDGKILKGIESIYLNKTDFSTNIKHRKKRAVKKHPYVFELRTYYCLPDRLPALETRFRNHTMRLFEKHGMVNIAYWKTVEKDGQQPRLVYILAHPSEAAGKAAFDAFRQDPAWIKVRDDSEKDGKIVDKIESVYMKPLAFSKIK
ncbi:MAG: NIPSNAP family protein [Saprospiraceae bacterium]|nr:NIPSNAP family protein [Saprospiraceae bacterium]